MVKDAEQTKQNIITAALELFTEKGYYETKVSDIVKRAGVAQGTFYLYFPTKESLFIRILNNTNQAMLEQIEHIFAEKVSLEMSEEEIKESLFATIKGCKTMYREHRDIMYILRVHGVSQIPEVQKIMEEADQSLHRIIIHLFKKFQLFPEYDQNAYEIAARAIHGMLTETCLHYIILQESTEEDITKVARVLTEMIYDMTLGSK
ncbi:TetR/AcrR family transcriptional regulator [Paenibacillus turpanensis]|uniref:TetR/AcrR family transcriptional regulator n=1 Tax=Paenibacillus turpanensis TaxID=2689078 RepID=UPI00140BA0C0|nr:TetR/AcrR family transcriptional regulator [Paenibacillus turpanensis]